MTKHQMKKYVEVRKKEIDMDERKKKFANKGGADTSSVYRAFSRLVCNFAFPEEIVREFPQDIRLLKKKELSQNDDDKNSDNDDEDGIDINKEVAVEYELKLNNEQLNKLYKQLNDIQDDLREDTTNNDKTAIANDNYQIDLINKLLRLLQ